MTILPMNQLLRVRETLVSINLAYHSLISLPEEFFHLRALKVINLKANCLLALPPSIAKLTSLQELDVSWNLLEALPVQLAELAGSLKTLKLCCRASTGTSIYSRCWETLTGFAGQCGCGCTANVVRSAQTGVDESIDALANGEANVSK